MAYRRRRVYKKRTPKPWYRKKYSVSQMASAAYKGVKYIKGLVNSEMFDVVTAASNTSMTNTGTGSSF